MRILFPLLIFSAIGFVSGAEQAEEKHVYTSGFSTVLKISKQLQELLPAKNREQIYPQPITLELFDAPIIKPTELSEDNRPFGQVFISAGFIDLMNHVSHARAIDKIERGYFQKYILSLAEENGESALKELPNISNPRFWTDEVMNGQMSHFNQMTGMIIAMNLSHHYLGHYKKYCSALNDPKKQPACINDFLSASEWEHSLKSGAHNALDCALAADGLKALFDAIDKMPKRPLWTAYFLPAKTNVGKTKKQLEKFEKDFFRGQLTD